MQSFFFIFELELEICKITDHQPPTPSSFNLFILLQNFCFTRECSATFYNKLIYHDIKQNCKIDNFRINLKNRNNNNNDMT